MQKSYVAKTTINFVDYGFYVRPGDVLVHDTSNHRLTVQRNGQIEKVVKQGALALSAFEKNKFIEEIPTTTTPVAVEVPKATPVAIVAPVSPVEPRKPIVKKAEPLVVLKEEPHEQPVTIEK